jgi:endonuclease/exonuclease/phosphatase family metal-dependent hydrolase
MTWNLYQGGSIGADIDSTWASVGETDFPARAKGIAAEIAAARPDLVGLQEVALWRSQVPGDGPISAATHVEYDFLELLLAELRAAGAEYEPVSIAPNQDVELTGASGNDYRFTGRDVALARSGIEVASERHGTYDAKLPAPFPSPGSLEPTLGVPRAWASVELRLGGRLLRFVTTHLEAFDGVVNGAQAGELVRVAGADLPVVVVGDLNSEPGEVRYPAHAILVNEATGFLDAWSEAGTGPGATCCHDPLLRDPSALPSRRIDAVLYRGGFAARSAAVVCGDPATSQAGLWPSDHCAVVATLELR